MRTRLFTNFAANAGKSMIGPASSATGPLLSSAYHSFMNGAKNADSDGSAVKHEEETSSMKLK